MAVKQAHIRIKGRVQGVFFRAHTQDKAECLGLTGWVRNTPDGGVEIRAEGEEQQLKALVAWCRIGPPAAMIADVDVAYTEAKGVFNTFQIRYTV